jgi:hypothetical protein
MPRFIGGSHNGDIIDVDVLKYRDCDELPMCVMLVEKVVRHVGSPTPRQYANEVYRRMTSVINNKEMYWYRYEGINEVEATRMLTGN